MQHSHGIGAEKFSGDLEQAKPISRNDLLVVDRNLGAEKLCQSGAQQPTISRVSTCHAKVSALASSGGPKAT